jgi:hypothetical protein
LAAANKQHQQRRDSLDRPEQRARKARLDRRAILDKRVTQARGVIGDIRAIRDIRVRQDKRAIPAIEARRHHVPPDSIAILIRITDEWIACRTRQELTMMREVGRVIQTPPLS